jgi:uncharacterized DUF497 family protein
MAEEGQEMPGSLQGPDAGRKRITWNPAKNDQLKRERGIAFETIAYYLDQAQVLAVTAHPNPERYPNQRLFVFQINDYIYLVPFVESDTEIFLKTIIPSRKATRAWLGRRPPHDPAHDA